MIENEKMEAKEVQSEQVQNEENTEQVFEDKIVITKFSNEYKIERFDEDGNPIQTNPVFDLSVESVLKGAIDIINNKRFEQMVQSHNQLYGDLTAVHNFLMSQFNVSEEGTDEVDPKVEMPE